MTTINWLCNRLHDGDPAQPVDRFAPTRSDYFTAGASAVLDMLTGHHTLARQRRKGNYGARKRLPDDVRDEYAKLCVDIESGGWPGLWRGDL